MNTRTTVTAGRSEKTARLVLMAFFTAIIIAMSFTPYLGYIPLGFMNATIIHIPVIIGALFLGPKRGAVLGGVFGLTSMINNTVNPNVTSFVFSPFYSSANGSGSFASIIICMVPRILIGVVAYYVFIFMRKLLKKMKSGKAAAFAAAGVAGAMTNTILVMGGIYLMFGENYAAAKGVAQGALYKLIITIVGTYGIPEALLAGFIVTAVGMALSVVVRNQTVS